MSEEIRCGPKKTRPRYRLGPCRPGGAPYGRVCGTESWYPRCPYAGGRCVRQCGRHTASRDNEACAHSFSGNAGGGGTDKKNGRRGMADTHGWFRLHRPHHGGDVSQGTGYTRAVRIGEGVLHSPPSSGHLRRERGELSCYEKCFARRLLLGDARHSRIPLFGPRIWRCHQSHYGSKEESAVFRIQE